LEEHRLGLEFWRWARILVPRWAACGLRQLYDMLIHLCAIISLRRITFKSSYLYLQ